tara:strand:+ start:149596 stop:150819 length:1224 start_codon:yes stop_codon:yes gene_type:complete
VLLIFADDVGSDAIGCYGGQSYPTPHIDALADGGIQFDYGFAMPVCHPSRVCLLTGRYPLRFGAAGSRWGLFPEAAESTTLAQVMRRGGYATAVAGKWQLCTLGKDPMHPQRLGFDKWCLFGWHEGGRYNDPLIHQNGKQRTDTKGRFGPDMYVDFLIDFMDEQHREGTPFLAYYPMALCHDVTDDLKGRHVAYYTHGRWMTFAEMISAMDDRVGRLVAALDRMGNREQTLIIFTTDNGTANATYLTVGDDGKMVRPRNISVRDGKVVPGGKGKLSDDGTRVPLIANWTGQITPGQKSDAMVDLTDYLPTLADLAGVEPPEAKLDGVSFAPILTGDASTTPRNWVYSEHRDKSCIRSRDYRLYRDGRFFDVRNDPQEKNPLDTNSLSGPTRDELDRLREQLSLLKEE